MSQINIFMKTQQREVEGLRMGDNIKAKIIRIITLATTTTATKVFTIMTADGTDNLRNSFRNTSL
jgi:hypothetical protein